MPERITLKEHTFKCPVCNLPIRIEQLLAATCTECGCLISDTQIQSALVSLEL